MLVSCVVEILYVIIASNYLLSVNYLSLQFKLKSTIVSITISSISKITNNTNQQMHFKKLNTSNISSY